MDEEEERGGRGPAKLLRSSIRTVATQAKVLSTVSWILIVTVGDEWIKKRTVARIFV